MTADVMQCQACLALAKSGKSTLAVHGVDLAGQVLNSRGFTLGVLRRACTDASDALEAVGLAVTSGEWAWKRQDRGLAVTVAALLGLAEDALGRARVVTERLAEVESNWDAGGDEEHPSAASADGQGQPREVSA